MDEQSLQTPETVAASAPQKPEPPKVDINKLFLPGAILIAAVLISGTLLYTKFAGLANNPGTGQQASILVGKNLLAWAGEVKAKTKEFEQCFDDEEFKTEIEKDLQDGTAAGVSGTPTFFINGTSVVGALPYSEFQKVINAALANSNARGPAVVSTDDDPALGDPNAPVTIIEFSDFECPFCRRFWQETLPQIKAEYIDTGKARFVYRDFPLSMHPGAFPAALAANCANQQGKFWEMHDKIFSEQI